MIVDSHCHLNMFEDQEEVIQRAKEAGVDHLLTIATNLPELPDLEAICLSHQDCVEMTMGVHPDHAPETSEKDLEEAFLRLQKEAYVVGVGEIGLDYHQDPSDPDKALQRRFFELQMDLARKAHLPVSIHSRAAVEDTEAILRNCPGSRGVLHCFGETTEVAKRYLDLGFYISLSGIVTFKKALNVQEVARYVPLDRLLIETDAPFLAPEPHRGQRNEPAFVVISGRFIASLRGIPEEELFRQTIANFEALWHPKHEGER